MNHVYIGIDLSLAATGLVAIDASDAGPVMIITAKTIKPKTRYAPRLAEISREVVDFILDHTPDCVAMEAISGGNAPWGNAIQIPELHGAVKLRLMENRMHEPWYVAAATLKKFATGSGRGEKSDVKMSILSKWNEEIRDNNQADAYVLARIAGAIHGGLLPGTDYERETIAALRKGALNEMHRAVPA